MTKNDCFMTDGFGNSHYPSQRVLYCYRDSSFTHGYVFLGLDFESSSGWAALLHAFLLTNLGFVIFILGRRLTWRRATRGLNLTACHSLQVYWVLRMSACVESSGIDSKKYTTPKASLLPRKTVGEEADSSKRRKEDPFVSPTKLALAQLDRRSVCSW